ncbi:BlaI/MecI/CopY family transcriptional regulator [Lentisphaerota bacterium WC36G]|nr:BlaI/MecI/CopY family transcriptional regulator [Lentisphaerae bacterium WC36]
MKEKMPKLTPPEIRIMKAVWIQDGQSLTEILEKVNDAAQKSFNRSTLNMQLLRLLKKGWLTQSQKGNRLFYSATVSEEDASFEIVNDVKKQLFGGSCLDLVKALLSKDNQISKEEIVQIREMINDFEDKTK